ncbi:hypothetical protein BDV29DRAFT_195462 [Aspergillus leporis]|uniref:Heterokaryon incompatibility domain-containing protein n=1 Tax=Aspergillus leporis TaxID=41062 RepID=A0A5N5WJJ7_9EURO|nr:hypothetical protein BDV29DRAFT_195462 [Aspergillus leporis]
MRLLSASSLEIEEFMGHDVPQYAILSHTWGEEEYAFVDTCCIDKTSSAEVSEAINSMMNWYIRSDICFTYLEDVPATESISDLYAKGSPFRPCRWFTRGLTRQELPAPPRLHFFSKCWKFLSKRNAIAALISGITRIDEFYLLHSPTLTSIAERMFWASNHETSRLEDTTYCLLGEIMKHSDDQSLLAWGFSQRRPCVR